jgi:DNA-binding LacI/PurR family transcriptional regulator
MRSTIKDVAIAAGVTAGTVSRALRGDPRVIESTRKRILEAAQRLEYRPNLQARALQTGRTGAVGLACASGPWILVHPYFAPMHAGFTSTASKDGVRVLLYMPPGEGKLELDAHNIQARELLDGRVDGGLIYQAQTLSRETLNGLQEMGVAVVLMNTDEEIPGFYQVVANTEQRIRESMRWAHELGARRVGVLGLSAGTPFNEVARRGVESARLPVSITYQEVASDDPYQVQAMDSAMDAMIAEKPDAVIFNTDFHVGHFLQRQLEGSLPKGLELFAYGGTDNSAFLSFPGVHYLETDLWAAGRHAYMMFKDAHDRKPPRSERLFWSRRP